MAVVVVLCSLSPSVITRYLSMVTNHVIVLVKICLAWFSMITAHIL